VDPLETVEKELNEATRRAWTLVQSTDGRLFTVRPKAQSWSAAECLAHLSISTEMFLPVLRKSIDDSRRKQRKGNPKMDVVGRVLAWFLEPPIRKRVKTAAPFVPKSTRAKAEAFGEFVSLQEKLMDLLRDAREVDLRAKIVSPFNARVRYNLLSAFHIVAAHERRHLWQAEQAVVRLTPALICRPA
jgi:hypothetical protein